jgi:O-antigen/teichoic acid export membrane protein
MIKTGPRQGQTRLVVARMPTIFRALAISLAAVHLVLVARLVGRGAFGDFAAAFALAGIIVAVAEFGLTTTGVVAVAQAREQDRRRVGGELFTASVVLSGGAAAVATVVGALVLVGDARTNLWLLLPWAAARGLLPGFVALRRGQGQYMRVATGELIGWAVTCALTALLASHGTSGQRTLGVATALLVGVLAQLCCTASPIARGSREGTRRCLMMALPLGLTNALSALHVRVDQVVLAGFGLTGALAAYAVAYRVFDAVLALVTVLAGVSFAVMMRAPGTSRPDVSRALSDRLTLIAGIVAAGCYALAPVLVRVPAGAEYADSAILVRLLCPALAAAVLNAGAAQAVIAGGKRQLLLPIAIIGVVLNLGINLVLVPRTGGIGAATATSFTETLGFLMVARIAGIAMPGWARPGTWLLPFLALAGTAVVVEVAGGGSLWWLAALPALALPALTLLRRAGTPFAATPRLDRAIA